MDVQLAQVNAHGFFHPVISKLCEAMGVASQGAIARSTTERKIPCRRVVCFISREGRNYILLCTLSDYFDFVSDEDGKLRRYLFESNVRDYLGEVQINRDIQETLTRSDSPEQGDFWWLNNGVTILGTNASVAGKELCVENVQIVNGLQTTETIYCFFDDEDGAQNDDRAVLVKVILAADDATRARIVKATNLSIPMPTGR